MSWPLEFDIHDGIRCYRARFNDSPERFKTMTKKENNEMWVYLLGDDGTEYKAKAELINAAEVQRIERYYQWQGEREEREEADPREWAIWPPVEEWTPKKVLICDICGTPLTKEEAEDNPRLDPYAWELNGQEVERNYCAPCYKSAGDDI